MTESLTTADGTNTPIGSLANYSLTQTAISGDPADNSGQIPTFNVTVTEPSGDVRALVGQDVILEDWTTNKVAGRVVAAQRSARSGAVSLDANSIFERLNTTQTTLPFIYNETASVDPVAEAMAHWFLTAGVPPERLSGNLIHYIGGNYLGSSSYGYIADSISKWRWYGPPSNYEEFVPSAETYANPIEVNASQSVTFGGAFDVTKKVSEVVIGARIPSKNDVYVYYTLRRVDSTWTLYEEVLESPQTALVSATWTPTSATGKVYVFAQVKANAATGKVDVTLRLMEKDANSNTVFTDTSVTAVDSTLRLRPRPLSIKLGYDSSLTGGRSDMGRPISYFLLSSAAIQGTYPEPNYTIKTGNDTTGTEWKATNPFKIPGFTDNVWDKLREFCAILELDVALSKDLIAVTPREDRRTNPSTGEFIAAGNYVKSNLVETVTDREPAKAVEVVYREMVGSDANFNNTLLWKADSVYSLDKGETKEEIIQTDSSFVFLHQPIAVNGVPVPYTLGYSSYVITGADGYIVDPQWWVDNGGSIKVYNTKTSGEIKVVMQAPSIDTVRAPYRVSEGVADRPALYILGKGMRLSDPKTVKVYTGAEGAAQEVGITYDSIFNTKRLMAYNTAHKLAVTYGTAQASVQFGISKADQLVPGASDPLTPLADSIFWGGSYYRIVDESVGPRAIAVSKAIQFNTIRVVNGEFATGKTIADWNALHTGKKIRDVNIAPLPKSIS